MAMRLQDGQASMSEMRKAQLFYLTEPSRGVFVVNVTIGYAALARFEISRDQLANFLVDGAAMALRSSHASEITTDQIESSSGGK